MNGARVPPVRVLLPPVRMLLPLVLMLAAVLLLLRDTAAGMVETWLRSDTFTHAFLVPPIVLWLIWRQRGALHGVDPKPVPWLLLPIAGACAMWLAGELAEVTAASQFALVTVIVLAVPALVGWRVTRVLLFPLGFLYFAVPLGEFLVPWFMDHTADFTVAALRLTGIPVYREGLQFVIPSGSWSVVQACSGVRYLIASFMVGTLYAYLNYRTLKRRLAFVAVSIAVPVLANWVRAYLIVMIGHLSGNKYAVGVDHLIYGWLFFGIVVGLMFWIGARWAQHWDPAPVPVAPVGSGGATAAAPRGAGWAVAAGIVALVLGTQVWLWQLDRATARELAPLALPDTLAGGWQAVDEPLADWRPSFENPNRSATRTYVKDGRQVMVWVGYYRHQGPERKLVSSVNDLVGGDSDWARVRRGSVEADGPGGLTTLIAGDLREPTPLAGAAPQRLRVWLSYAVDGHFTGRAAEVKLRQVWSRLRGAGDDGAAIVIATPLDDDADSTLGAFWQAQRDSLPAWLEAAAGSS